MNMNQFSQLSKSAIVLAVLSVAVNISYTSSSTIDGQRTCTFMDYGALGFGAAATVVGVVAMIKVRAGGDPIVSRIASALAIAVGVWRTLHGLGMLGGPC